ncbi:uncharacterized protein LOC106965519 [Acinonyx jubatus]|uniref:Uncharacterized protein LOC106965519 n=1 Tax=Acinonyx jubatus TaxID=32536 RepID=A0A6I9ZFF5_ACIJB|nr:uncharacterized protein LOC106965519 [Acinonyx jubatus]
MAHVMASSKCRPKPEKPILWGQPEGTPPPYCPLYPSLPPAPPAAPASETPPEPAPSPEALPPLAPPASLDVTGSLGPNCIHPCWKATRRSGQGRQSLPAATPGSPTDATEGN